MSIALYALNSFTLNVHAIRVISSIVMVATLKNAAPANRDVFNWIKLGIIRGMNAGGTKSFKHIYACDSKGIGHCIIITIMIILTQQILSYYRFI